MISLSRPATRALLVVLALGGACGAFPAVAAAVHNDNFADRDFLDLNTPVVHSNVGASIEPPEALTRNTDFCDDPTSGAAAMGSTLWWEIEGNGGTITVSTNGSGFDTVLGVWSGSTLLGCDDDVLDHPSFRYSELRFGSAAGASYWVQVGGLCTEFDMTAEENCAAAEEGNARVAAWTPPPNDARANAEAAGHGSLIERDNLGATEAGGEQTTCNSARGASPFGKTIWFRFDAPDKGTARFTASGFDTVLAVYAGDSPNYLACDDDPNASGPSQLSVDVSPGASYYVQVGGWGPGVAADDGIVTYGVSFEVDRDWDDDGVTGSGYGGGDCDDRNPNIRPGIGDVEDNDVDENCDGYREYDADDDDYVAYQPRRTPSGYDCNDRNRRINPGRREIRGNSVDENCDGRKGRALLISSRIQGDFTGAPGGVKATGMTVRSVLGGAVITARCKGGCPFSRKVRRIGRRTRRVSLLGWFGDQTLRSGASLRITVVPPSGEWIGKTTLYRVRGSNVDPVNGCVSHRGRARRCPG
jgi:hypothetical protein